MSSKKFSFPGHDGSALAALLETPETDQPRAYALMLGFVATLGGLGLWLLSRGVGLRS